MSRRKHNLPEQPSLIANPNPDATSVSTGAAVMVNRYPPQSDQNPEPYRDTTQLDRANALARAREEGFREGTIAGMSEAAAMVHANEDNCCGNAYPGEGEKVILAELHRRFPNDPRVAHHLALRGLA